MPLPFAIAFIALSRASRFATWFASSLANWLEVLSRMALASFRESTFSPISSVCCFSSASRCEISAVCASMVLWRLESCSLASSTARSFSSRLFLCHVFRRLFFSPGSQRWQNVHWLPFLQAFGPLCAAKAQGRHSPRAWRVDPLLGRPSSPSGGSSCRSFSSSCGGAAVGCTGGRTCTSTSRPLPPRLCSTAFFIARAIPWSRMSWAASFISSATLSKVPAMALSMELKKPHMPAEPCALPACWCTEAGAWAGAHCGQKLPGAAGMTTAAGSAASPSFTAAMTLPTTAVARPCSLIWFIASCSSSAT
mmetsp:Transcript_1139/g.2472  ORF Transcript_1139/g.2472 Transcript_1139/m.2472 type:complete len:308 (-) Transcript_1139:281-1204(-)